MHHLTFIGEVKLELQSGNAPFGSKSAIFLSRVTLIFDGWHWKNRAPLLSCFKLCESFYSHWWIQTGVTTRKRPIWVKIDDFVSRVTLKFDGWPWKTIRHLFYATSSFVHDFIIICEFKVTARKGLSWVLTFVTLTFDLWPWPFARTSRPSMVITPKNSGWYDDRNIAKKVWPKNGQTDGRTDGRTDGQTEGSVLRAGGLQLKMSLDKYSDARIT